MAWTLSDDPSTVELWAPGMPEPRALLSHLADGGQFVAHNAHFELLIWQNVIARDFPSWPQIGIGQASCTMARAYAQAYPGALDELGAALGVDDQKDKIGAKAMLKMCKPDARIWRAEQRIVWHDTPELRAALYAYCKQDVRTEIAIDKKLPELTPSERVIWELDWKINCMGIRVDDAFCKAGSGVATREKKRANADLVALTKGFVTSASASVALRAWLAGQGVEIDNVKKRTIERLINETPEGTADEIIQALELRQEASRSSLKKFDTALKCLNDDGRIRGQIQYHGATTGRFAGRLMQPHNLKRCEFPEKEATQHVDAIIAHTLSDDAPEDFLNVFWGDAIWSLANCMRASVIPADGCELFYGDFANIEGRTLAWLAGEEWKLDAYRDYDAGIGPDTYKLAYASSFGIPVADVTAEQRQIGKVQELACIAEGQPVLTDKGLVPLERVTTAHKVWDGCDFVAHDGIIFKGFRHVFEHDGLTATADHRVWVYGQPEPIPFGHAAASGSRLIRSGDAGEAIRLGESDFTRTPLYARLGWRVRACSLHRMRARKLVMSRKSDCRKIEGLPIVLATASSSEMAVEARNGDAVAVHKSEGSRIFSLRGARHSFRVRYRFRRRLMGAITFGFGSNAGLGSDRQQRELCSRQFALRDTFGELAQSTPIQSDDGRGGMGAPRKPARLSHDMSLSSQGLPQRGYCRHRVQSGFRPAQELARHPRPARFARVFDIINAGPRNRFTVSNVLVHNCGYQGAVGAFRSMGENYGVYVLGPNDVAPKKAKQVITEEQAGEFVKAWREAHPNIRQFWYDLEAAAIRAIQHPTTLQKVGYVAYHFSPKTRMLRCRLPSGRVLSYPGADLAYKKVPWQEEPKLSLRYWGIQAPPKGTGHWQQLWSYGGHLAENCLAGDTRVCTNRGWVNLIDVQQTDLIYDGVEFVSHGGLVAKGEQSTLSLSGVRMTPDHRVLTSEGWRNASSCEGLDRAKVRMPRSTELRGRGRAPVALARSLRLWGACYSTSKRFVERAAEIVRLHEGRVSGEGHENARHEPTPGLRSLSKHDRSLPAPDAPCLEELRRSRYSSLRRLGCQLRELLGRHGRKLCAGIDVRPYRRKRPLLQSELPLGFYERARQEQATEYVDRDALGRNVRVESRRTFGYRSNDVALSTVSELPGSRFVQGAGRSEQVFDLLNCGPRNRFVVFGNDGPFIVHNCTQAAARDILAAALYRLDKHGYAIPLHVHDEIVCEVPKGTKTVDDMARLMTVLPQWATGLPVAVKVQSGKRYYK